ncbi:MAG: DUF3899 domain-containing protein [Clostridia bacterium]|nr:DUF3899 domain-containing protein [Clostridia bacterium]
MRSVKKYLITAVIGLLAVGAIVWSKDLFAQTAPVTVFHILCDAFFAVGVVIFAAGVLVFSSNEGTFDIFVYGVSSFVDMFRKKSQKKYNTFYEYRESREDLKLPFGFLMLTGAVFIAVSLVMLYFYNLYK